MDNETFHILNGVSVAIEKGSFVAIMGPSGSGKSTLMNIIGCLDTFDSGDYYLNGKLVSHASEDELALIRRNSISFVFQQFNLVPRITATRNVELPLFYARVDQEERRSRAIAALESVGLGQRLNHLPSQMSGGQQQRVAIARALVTRPDLVIADEPTGSLDSKTSVEVMDIFTRMHEQGKTIVMVTHEQDVADYAQRIIRIRDGVVESDSTTH